METRKESMQELTAIWEKWDSLSGSAVVFRRDDHRNPCVDPPANKYEERHTLIKSDSGTPKVIIDQCSNLQRNFDWLSGK